MRIRSAKEFLKVPPFGNLLAHVEISQYRDEKLVEGCWSRERYAYQTSGIAVSSIQRPSVTATHENIARGSDASPNQVSEAEPTDFEITEPRLKKLTLERTCN